MNTETIELKVSITKQTYSELLLLTKRQNANLHNNIDRLIMSGIKETYNKYPLLKEQQNDQ